MGQGDGEGQEQDGLAGISPSKIKFTTLSAITWLHHHVSSKRRHRMPPSNTNSNTRVFNVPLSLSFVLPPFLRRRKRVKNVPNMEYLYLPERYPISHLLYQLSALFFLSFFVWQIIGFQDRPTHLLACFVGKGYQIFLHMLIPIKGRTWKGNVK